MNPNSQTPASVVIRAQSFVLPNDSSRLTDMRCVPLSNLDHVFCSPEQYPGLVFFYHSSGITPPPTCPDTTTSLVHSLQQSLAVVLNDYPVVAGRVRAAENAQGRLELVLSSSDGMLFSEATTEARLDYWPDLSRCSLLMELIHVPQQPKSGSFEDVPLAQVQVTVFKCGGVALGFSFAHILADGMAAVEFLQAWGKIHQGQRLSLTPFLFRTTVIRAGDPPQLTDSIPETTTSLMMPTSTINKELQLSPNGHLHSMPWQPCILSSRLSDETVRECVEEVKKGPFGYGAVTAHEAICALVWSSLTRAKGWSSEEEKSRFVFPINIRNRRNPALPAGYFGNAILLTYVVTKAKLIANLHFSYAAKLIHEATIRYTAAFCQLVIDWTELQLQNRKCIRLSFAYPEAYGSTSFVGFPLYEVSFGWGEPAYVAFIQLPSKTEPFLRSGVLIMPSPLGGKSRDLTILCSTKKHMDALLCDSVFLRYHRP